MANTDFDTSYLSYGVQQYLSFDVEKDGNSYQINQYKHEQGKPKSLLTANSFTVESSSGSDEPFTGRGVPNKNIASITTPIRPISGDDGGYGLAYLFKDCVNLQEVDLTTDVVAEDITLDWHDCAFMNCTSLRTVNVGTYFSLSRQDSSNTWRNSTVGMHSAVFYGCSNLETITGVFNITLDNIMMGDGMFTGCDKLTGVQLHLPDSQDEQAFINDTREDTNNQGYDGLHYYEILGLTADQFVLV